MGKVNPNIGEGAAFRNAGYCLNKTRAIINDVMESNAGDVLTDDWDATWDYLNIAHNMCQEYLANNGVETNIKEVFLAGITPVANTDPSTQVWISQSGYYDGANNHDTPTLPADIIIPIRIFERFDLTQNPFVQITPANDGLDGFTPQMPYFRQYEWRGNMLVLPGATMQNQLRFRYIAYFADLTAPDSVLPYPRIAIALAWMTAFVFANARGDQTASATLKGEAYTQLDNIVSYSIRRKQRRGVSRRPYGGFRRFGWI